MEAQSSLRFFIDSASLDVWKKWLPTGVFHGVTTNPLLLKQSNVPCQIRSLNNFTKQALSLGAKEVHLVAWGRDVDSLVRTASELCNIDRSVVVQVPATYHGFRSAKKLKDMGARVGLGIHSAQQVSLVGLFDSNKALQALSALAIGAEYAALNFGKVGFSLDDSRDALLSIQRMYRVHGGTRLLLCNVSSIDELIGLESSTSLTPPVIEQLFNNAFTEDVAAEFDAATTKHSFGLFM